MPRPARTGLSLPPLLVLPMLAWPAHGNAVDWETGGHLKYQYTIIDFRADDAGAVFGDDPAQDDSLELRLKAEGRSGPWHAAVHYELLGVAGDTVQSRQRLDALGLALSDTPTGLPDDRRRLFDLTHVITDDDRRVIEHRLDRLALGYSTDTMVLRFGRQAISWGNGLVFNPLDFVNPFSPIAIDKDYKTGDDMLYGQWTLRGGGDVQAILLPRRDLATHDVESEESTAAAKWRRRVGQVDIDLLVARHFDENLLGLGFTRSIGGAVGRLDLSVTDTGDDTVYSLVTNLDYSWTWLGRNTYGYVEYFHNGFGESDRADYSNPDPELAERIARGELFTLARDYTALGLQIELTPLFNLYQNLLWNLNDGSIFYQLRGIYDWQQNLQLQAGVNLPSGDRGDEYGGIPLGSTGAFVTPGRAIYARVAYYF